MYYFHKRLVAFANLPFIFDFERYIVFILFSNYKLFYYAKIIIKIVKRN